MKEEKSVINEQQSKAKRPTSITVICVLMFIERVPTVLYLIRSVGKQVVSWYQPYVVLSAVIVLACLAGLWMMKKWAAYTYNGFTVINQFVLLVMGVWNIMALIIPAIVIFFALKNSTKMTYQSCLTNR